MWGAILPAAASLIGGWMASEGQEDTNQQNRDIARENSAFNAEQAQMNRDFQERMANTSYQRAVPDMKKAGLNPMLAYSQGGAHSPSGATGQAVQPAEMRNAAGAGVAAAAQAAQASNLNANTDNIRAQTDNVNADTEIKKAELPRTQQGPELRKQEIEKTKNEAREMLERVYRTYWDASRIEKEIARINKDIDRIAATTKNVETDTILKQLEIPGAKNEAEHQRKYGPYNINIKPFIRDAGAVVNSAGAAARAFTRR